MKETGVSLESFGKIVKKKKKMGRGTGKYKIIINNNIKKF